MCKVLDVKDLAIIFNRQGKPFIAVNQISFDIKKGEIFGLVGESGSGKTTTGRATLGLVKHSYGTITLNNRRVPSSSHYTNKKSNEWLAKNVQMIFQDPLTSLNPSKRVIDIVLEGFKNFNPYKIQAKDFIQEKKIALKWYKKLKSYDEQLINNYQNRVVNLQSLYNQLYSLILKNKLMWNESKNDIKDNYYQSVNAAKTKHQLLIARKLQIIREELRNVRFKTKQLLIKTGLNEWEKKWQIEYDKKIAFLNDEKTKLLQELQKKELFYKQKLNDAILKWNNKKLAIDQITDGKAIILNELINNHQKRYNELIKIYADEQKNIDLKYRLSTENANKEKDLVSIKNFKNEQKADLKILKIELYKEIKLEKKKIAIFKRDFLNYRLSSLTILRVEINKAKKYLRKLRYKDSNKFKIISKKIEKAEHKWESEKNIDRKNFVDQIKLQEFQVEYKNRINEVNEKFEKLIITDKEKIPKFIQEAKIKKQKALQELLIKWQQNINEIKELKISIFNEENKLNDLRQLINKKNIINEKKVKLIIAEYIKLKKQLKLKFYSEINNLKQLSLSQDKIYNSKINLEKQFIHKNNELLKRYFEKLLKIDLYKAQKLKLKYEYNSYFSYKAIKKRTKQKAYETLQSVGLLAEHADRFPFEFSGGQRQRIGIARALVMQPELLVADEPISALDVSIQAQVINILKDLRQKYQLSILLIAHDLRMVHYICDRIAVIRNGVIIEIGNADEIFYHPVHPYTKSLISAVPSINNIGQKIEVLKYNPHAHGYNEEIKPLWHKISQTHKVLATNEEFQLWTKKK